MKLKKLLNQKSRLKVAIIGSHSEIKEYALVAKKIGKLVAVYDHILINGGCTGLPGLASESALLEGGISIGISPNNQSTFSKKQIIINTGFGYKGRNIIIIRSANIVLCLPGKLGTINELTIALDENKPCYFVDSNLSITKITKPNFLKSLNLIYLKNPS
jgi:hypothetical protein